MPKAYWITTYRSVRHPALRQLGDGADRDMRIVPGYE